MFSKVTCEEYAGNLNYFVQIRRIFLWCGEGGRSNLWTAQAAAHRLAQRREPPLRNCLLIPRTKA